MRLVCADKFMALKILKLMMPLALVEALPASFITRTIEAFVNTVAIPGLNQQVQTVLPARVPLNLTQALFAQTLCVIPGGEGKCTCAVEATASAGLVELVGTNAIAVEPRAQFNAETTEYVAPWLLAGASALGEATLQIRPLSGCPAPLSTGMIRKVAGIRATLSAQGNVGLGVNDPQIRLSSPPFCAGSTSASLTLSNLDYDLQLELDEKPLEMINSIVDQITASFEMATNEQLISILNGASGEILQPALQGALQTIIPACSPTTTTATAAAAATTTIPSKTQSESQSEPLPSAIPSEPESGPVFKISHFRPPVINRYNCCRLCRGQDPTNTIPVCRDCSCTPFA